MAEAGFEEAFGQTEAGKGTFAPYLSLSVSSGVNTDPRVEYRLGHRAGWRGMSGMWPQPQVSEDFLNDVGLVDKGNLCGAPHKSPYVKRLIM